MNIYFIICLIPAILCTIITMMLLFMYDTIMTIGFGIATILLWRHCFIYGRTKKKMI